VIPRGDFEIVSLLARRDSRGLEMAYENYAARVRSFLYRMTRRDDLSDDLLQVTFLKLAEKGAELRHDSDVRAWLFTVARNAYYDSLRLSPEIGLTDEHLNALPLPTKESDAELMLGDLEDALAHLRRQDRELLLLIGVEGLSHETVATMLHVQPATLRQRLSRARARLLSELERAQAPLGKPHERTSA